MDLMHPQNLINTGMAWTLEGHVGRTCMGMIERGDCILGPDHMRDYWGNVVPSRDEVEPGTCGSVEYANNLRAERGDDALTVEQFDAGLGVEPNLVPDNYWDAGYFKESNHG